MTQIDMVYPILTLITWTFVMWFWMYATRIPAIQRANVDMEELSNTGKPLELPAKVARVADNYNHLHEQPTIFYALALSASLIGAVDGLQVGLAWAYVGIRVLHSLIQSINNPIPIRFMVFVLGSLVLLVLLLRTLYLCL